MSPACTHANHNRVCFHPWQTLWLNDNQISDVGLASLADACANGALAPGAKVYLLGNNLTEAGKQAAQDAIKDCGHDLIL